MSCRGGSVGGEFTYCPERPGADWKDYPGRVIPLRPKAIADEVRYTHAEAAAALRCSTRTVSRLVKTGLLPAHYRPGVGEIRRGMYFTESDLAAYRKASEAGPSAATG